MMCAVYILHFSLLSSPRNCVFDSQLLYDTVHMTVSQPTDTTSVCGVE
jgi:hypothetical protein